MSTISEKTLELQITHEVLTRADYLSDLFSFACTQRCPPWFRIANQSISPPSRYRPPYAVGLSLQDEQEQGWDVKINVPESWGEARQALFLQFKRPRARCYSQDTDSKFYGSKGGHSPHCVFGINNNSKCDQHVVLRSLASGRQQEAVYYVLPRISSFQNYKACIGRLLLTSSVLSVDEVDRVGTEENITIQRGDAHKFRTSYDGEERELHSEVMDLDDVRDEKPALLAEIVRFRTWETLESWREAFREGFGVEQGKVLGGALLRKYLLNFAQYLAVPSRCVEELEWVGLDDLEQGLMIDHFSA